MTEEEIKQALDQLAEYKAQRTAIMLQKQELIDSILTPEIKNQIADVELEFAGKASAATEAAASLEMEIKEAVVALGKSVKGGQLSASFVKGRITWDTKTLDGYAVAHPEILFARNEGEPSCRIL
jgi:hypothetical protein